MKHAICNECECVNWCSRHRCIPITQGTLDEPIRPVNVIGSVSWLGIASAIVVGLAWAGYCIWLS